jgi:hypothetical protein
MPKIIAQQINSQIATARLLSRARAGGETAQ